MGPGSGSLGLLPTCCLLLLCLAAAYVYDDEPQSTLQHNSTAAYVPLDEEQYTWTSSSAAAASDPNSFSTSANAGVQQQSEYDDGYLPDKAHPDFMWDNCVQYADGSVALNGTATCSLRVQGVDIHADLLTGGLDGVYELVGCYYGKGLYVRLGSPLGEERCIWYNPSYGDWQFALSDDPADGDTVMYGNYGQISPLEVEDWHLGADFNAVESELVPPDTPQPLFYKVKGVTVSCMSAEDLKALYSAFGATAAPTAGGAGGAGGQQASAPPSSSPGKQKHK